MNDILSRVYFNNTVQEYLIAAAIILGGMLLLALFRKIVLTRLEKWANRTESNIDNLIIKAVERFALPPLNFFIMYVGINYLELSEMADKIIKIIVAAFITFFILRLISSVALQGLQSYVRRQGHGEEKLKQLGGIMLLLNIIIWTLGFIFFFDNLGYNVSAIITGLGIGGIAIALAAQNILGDLFNYFVIFFDRPFEIGDFIVLDDKKGNVEHIGIKTTRLKSLTGEQLILSNSDLTKSRLHNFKRMERRRIEFSIIASYATPPNLVKEVPVIIRNIITSIRGITLDRTHFLSYGEYGFKFETVYFVENAEYNVYADIQQEINLKILEAFEQRDIQFAQPGQPVIRSRKDK
ncbi:MAG TPA: mechanosensitive ion channel domain-containing protein [Chryseolinea sp.]|nr:mechanosensitive ion channel domain-containing protein [Chryseolinea sp.]